MTVLNRCHRYIYIGIGSLLILAVTGSANSMTVDAFNKILAGKECVQATGCQAAVDEALGQKAALQDVARMALASELQHYRYCILVGVTASALAGGAPPQTIIQMFQGIRGLDPTVFLAAMVKAGIPEREIKEEAIVYGVSEQEMNSAFAKARVADICATEDALAYTAGGDLEETGVIVGVPLPGDRRNYVEIQPTPTEDGTFPYSSPSAFDDTLAYTTPSTFDEDETLPYAPEEDDVLPYSSPSEFEDSDSE